MNPNASERLFSQAGTVMKIWEERANREVIAARQLQSLALRNSLPEYLQQLAKALSTYVDRTSARARADRADALRVGKKHGSDRAEKSEYTMDQMITEYRILREVIFDVLEEDGTVSPVEREVIVCSIEQAVNDAATQFSDSLRQYQERLTYTLAHDLRNPMAGAKMSAQLILRRSGDADTCMSAAARIIGSMDRLDSMICDLLDAGQVRAGKPLHLELAPCDLGDIARKVIDELNYTHPGRFKLDSHEPCEGSWNAPGIVRVLENLATNAIKYGKAGTPITVTVRPGSPNATVTVHNEGDPIPADEQADLFETFRRARDAKQTAGWGLGLTVVKGIVEAHQGKVSIRSAAREGTTVTIELPQAQAAR